MPDFQRHPIKAWRAMQAQLENPEDTEKVFEILRALSGKSLLHNFNRFAATEHGAHLLQARPALVETLTDRQTLEQLPAHSLGRAYLEFVRGENLTADGLVEASGDRSEFPERLEFYANRVRDMHDLWHVVTGYGRDTLGEACLLGFTFAQTRDVGIAFIALLGTARIARENDGRAFSALWRGYRAGRRARWLPAEDWEALLAEPLNAVRNQLGISVPEDYPQLSLAYAG